MVDFPWSIWATIEKFRMFAISVMVNIFYSFISPVVGVIWALLYTTSSRNTLFIRATRAQIDIFLLFTPAA